MDDEIHKKLDDYKQGLVDSNNDVSPVAQQLSDALRGTTDTPLNKYTLGGSNISDSDDLASRFSSRYNRRNAYQNQVRNAKSEQIAQQLTVDNRTKRINDMSEMARNKHDFETYNNLFSRSMGAMNAETQARKSMNSRLETRMHDIDQEVARNNMVRAKQKRDEDNSFGGMLKHGLQSVWHGITSFFGG